MTVLNFNTSLVNLENDMKVFAYRLTANKEEAKDLVQETYLKALRFCNKFIYDKNFKAWTFTIMKNIFINNYRCLPQGNKNSNQTDHNYKTVTDYSSFLPDSAYGSKELEGTIEKLKDNLRIPFKMLCEGFTYKEIAKSLDLRPCTVKSRIYIARKQLMEQITR